MTTISVEFKGRDELSGVIAGLGNKFNGLGDIVTGAFRRVGEIGVDLAGRGLEALGSAIGDSINVAGDFEATMNSFASVTGDAIQRAGLDMGNFRDLFLEMGAVTQYSAGQAAQAAVELAKGGIDPATIAAGGLEAALGLAAAGQLELATAAGITAKQLGVWGDTGVTAADVADLMAQAANASTVNVDELAMGMANVGGVAKVTGASFEETVQAMALLAPGFSSASDAGTSLKAFLSRLVPASEEAAGWMMELGLASEDANGEIKSNFFDASGAFIGFKDSAMLLKAGLNDLDEATKLEALGSIFGQDAIRAAAMLGEAGSVGLLEMSEAMTAAGTAAEQSAKLNQGWNFALESLKGSFETIQIVIGSALLPTITDFIQNAITPAVNSFLEWAQVAMPVIIAGLQQFGGVLLSILGTIDFGPLVGAFASLFDAMGVQMPTAGQTVQVVAAVITAAVQGIADFMNTILIPALATVVNFIAANWPAIQATAETVFSAIETIVNNVLTNVQFYVDLFTAAMEGDWRGFGEILRASWDETWAGIQEIVGAAIDWFTSQDWALIGNNIMQGIADGITAGAQWIMDAALAAVQAAVEVVKGFLGIESPSKLFFEIGENTQEGLAKGIEGSAGVPQRAALGAAQDVAGTTGDGLSGGVVSGGESGVNIGVVNIYAQPGQDGALLADQFLARMGAAVRAARQSGAAWIGAA